MSLELIKSVLQGIRKGSDWSLLLLDIKKSNNNATVYNSRQIKFVESNYLKDFLDDLSSNFVGNDKGKIYSYKDVRDYGDIFDAKIIYKLKSDNSLICDDYQALLNGIANADTKENPFLYKTAYLIDGTIQIEGIDTPVKLVSLQKPVSTFKRKLVFHAGCFKEIEDKILSLRLDIDAIIVKDTVYFLNTKGERLFNIERSYTIICQKKIAEIEKAGIVKNIELFKKEAKSGHNPRRFLAFNNRKLQAIKDRNVRSEIAKKFSIPLDPVDELFYAKDKDSVDKIIKVLCDKGMLDPFDGNAKEVDAARSWG